MKILSLLFMFAWSGCNSKKLPNTEVNEDGKSAVTDIKLFTTNAASEQHQLQFIAFEKSYSFNLNQANSIFTPEFRVIRSDDTEDPRNSFLTLQNSESLEGSFFKEVDGSSSFYIEHHDGKIQIEGIVDNSLTIRNSDGDHIATKLPIKKQKTDCATTILEYTSQQNNPPITHEEAVVEVLVLLDEIVYKNLTDNRMSLKKYLGIFYNFVESKFEPLTKPKVKFSITGVVPLDPEDNKWISATFVNKKYPDPNKILINLGRYLYTRLKKHPKYDVAVLHTGYDLARLVGNDLNTGIVGVATTTGVCLKDIITKIMYNSAVIEDHNAPLYSGAFTAAHEVAHLLGSSHDPVDQCGTSYIMAEFKPNMNPSMITFSQCSIKAITKHLSNPSASCVYKTGIPEIPILDEYPNLSREEICHYEYDKTAKATNKTEYVLYRKNPCEVVLCYIGSGASRALRQIKWVPEQTSCFAGKLCIQGKCVPG